MLESALGSHTGFAGSLYFFALLRVTRTAGLWIIDVPGFGIIEVALALALALLALALVDFGV